MANRQSVMRTHPLKSMASGPLKIEKGTCPLLIQATHRHTTESAVLGVICPFLDTTFRLKGVNN